MLFSINCLTYKRTELLEEALQSVLQQTFKDWELLIVNDCAEHTIVFEHPQVRIFNLKDKFKTIGEKRNFGIRQAAGELVIQLDDDDLFLPDYLNNLVSVIGDHDWLMAQRPILYYDDTDKVILSPVPQFNTFLYRRGSVFRKVNYPDLNYDELTPFYRTVTERSLGFRGVFRQLRPTQCGYVYRQNISSSKRYKMSDFRKESIEEQNTILENLQTKSGEIVLSPVWRKDYSAIVKHNMEILPVSSYKPMSELETLIKTSLEDGKKESNIWEPVKPSWANAMRFISSVKSRGLVSTALNVTGISKTMGERVSDEILAQRKMSCFGNPDKLIAPCTRLRVYKPPEGAQSYYCGGCGCGRNELARLDGDSPDDYTKLHYPYLECPLQRPGFSNQKDNILTVVITALNENPEMLNNTVKSIRDTSGEVEIIVVDDCSDTIVVPDDVSVKVIRNEKRIGCAQSRHKGALLAKNKYLLFTDSHMLFSPGWYDEFKRYANKEKENVAFCGVCLGLDSTHTTLDNYSGRYCGARLALYEEKENQVLEGKWIDEKDGESYEISCMMGAIYIINKEYFFKLRGLSDLKMWGSDEPCLALKILLSGGKMVLVKGIKAGHFFRESAPYFTGTDFLLYNKIRMAKTLLPEELASKLIQKLPKDGNFYSAMAMVEEEKDTIEEYKAYYQSVFTRSVEDVSKQYNISIP